MPVAHIVCAVMLRVEVYSEADGPAGRLLIEGKATSVARKNAETGKAEKLNPQVDSIGQDSTTGSSRPAFVLPALIPLSFALKRNSFRVPDDFQISIPLEALPVPPVAIRVITVVALVRNLSASEWAAGLSNGDIAARMFARNTVRGGNFEGIAQRHNFKISGGDTPKLDIKFVDYLGVTAAKAVPVGKELKRDIPVTEAIRDFLVGSPAEGLAVVWVDPTQPEPDLGLGTPKAKKRWKTGKIAKAPTHSGQKYIDAITKECEMLGVVPRVVGSTIQVAYAGTMYEGRDRGGSEAATLLLGSIIEDFSGEHELLGSKVHSVQVTSYNPDNGKHLVARWPPDPKGIKPIIEPGKPPRLPPVAANVGLPGAAQLDESILMIPVGPCTDPKVLREIARSIFVERTRQRMKYRIDTTAPWPDPDDPEAENGKLLALFAGDNIRFGVVADDRPTISRSVRAIVSGADAAAVAQLLRRQGIASDVAAKVAVAIASAPVASLWRVDELLVSSANEKEGAKIEITISNFTVVVSDLEETETRRSVSDYKKTANDLLVAAPQQTTGQVQSLYEAQFSGLSDSGMTADDQAEAHKALTSSFQQAMKGR